MSLLLLLLYIIIRHFSITCFIIVSVWIITITKQYNYYYYYYWVQCQTCLDRSKSIICADKMKKEKKKSNRYCNQVMCSEEKPAQTDLLPFLLFTVKIWAAIKFEITIKKSSWYLCCILGSIVVVVVGCGRGFLLALASGRMSKTVDLHFTLGWWKKMTTCFMFKNFVYITVDIFSKYQEIFFSVDKFYHSHLGCKRYTLTMSFFTVASESPWGFFARESTIFWFVGDILQQCHFTTIFLYSWVRSSLVIWVGGDII